MKTLKFNFAVIALGIGYLTTGCANRSNPDKVAYQVAAQQHYENMVVMTEKAKRGVAGISRGIHGATNTSNSYYPTYPSYPSGSGVWNGGVYVPPSGTYMQSSIDAEIKQCSADVNAIPKKYAQQRIILLHQCLQVALQYRNSYYTRMYSNTSSDTQNMWQYSSFYGFPAQYPQYTQNNQAYAWLNQYLSQGYVPQNVTYNHQQQYQW